MKLKEPNPLNFFNIRRAETPPDHFEYINIPLRYNLEEPISRWINDNLKSRFYLNKTLGVDEVSNDIINVIRIGFEEPKELSYFTLACPYLKYH